MESKKCHGCDRNSHSLFIANCGHKTCFYCYKNNKPVHKCRKCNEKSHSLSPFKNKSTEKPNHIQSQQTKHGGTISPFVETDRIMSASGRPCKDQKQIGETLMCLQHKQPLNMFCKNTKQIICSICLCRKNKYSQQILPLRNAEDLIKKQNKLFREQARIVQTNVENAWRVVNRNRQVFEQNIEKHEKIISQYYENLVQRLRQMQENSIKLCRNYLTSKMNELAEVSDDLTYLSQTLKQYRQNSSQGSSINELAYYYTSFNVIKKTIETLSFDYIPYQSKEIRLVDFDQALAQKAESELIRFRFNLHLKRQDKKSRSSSINSRKVKVSPDSMLNNKHKMTTDQLQYKKHKFSLCSNASVQYDQEDENLYKKLLKSKYKV